MNRKESFCPECDHRLKVGAHPHLGQKIRCPSCETGLVVTSLSPLDLDTAMPTNRSVRQKKKGSTVEVSCSECDHFIKLSVHARRGQQIICNMCNAVLEVVNTKPLELDLAVAVNLRQKIKKY
jgi:uncharacterized paraquat-inducible protein A